MKAGKILHRFTAKDRKDVFLRTLKWDDLDDIVELVNSLVDEDADIFTDRKVTKDEEADWLKKKLDLLEKDEELHMVAEVNGKVIANSSLKKNKGMSSHTGEIGIIVGRQYRNIGIGTKMLKTLISQAKKMQIRLLYLGVFSTNKLAYRVYEKVGFKEFGRRPKFIYKNGKYIDDVLMVKELE
jgi:RimJ/RimL family protein N-acetyltransferase